MRIALVVIMAFLVINAIISYRAMRRVVTYLELVAHTQEVLSEVSQTLAAMNEAESGQRGYMITHHDAYLADYRAGRARALSERERLSQLVADNPRQVARAAELRAAMDRRLERMESNVRLVQTEGDAAARASVQTGEGKREMDQLRSVLAAMAAEEQGLLHLRDRESVDSIRNATVSFAGASLIALFMVISAYVLINRDLSHRQQAERKLRAAHDQLEERVVERTLELRESNQSLESEIAERKQAQATLARFTTELERSNRELEDFAFVASHDLQEPLRKIQAFGDRLNMRFGGDLPPEGVDYLIRMQNAAERMHVLINDLLTFSRVRTKGQPFDQVDLNHVADEVLTDLEVRVQQSAARVEIGPLPVIAADPLQMRQLFQNLIGNALKFHPPQAPPVVTVRFRTVSELTDETGHVITGSYCQLEFEDHGIGFDEKYLDRIFQPFQRLRARGEYQGTGMGLAVCRRIVERHGGMITARSAVDQGTTFIVTLPVEQIREQ
jgi:signal transduction histidine kinase